MQKVKRKNKVGFYGKKKGQGTGVERESKKFLFHGYTD